jgi:serine/threonine-protein kinase
MDGELSPGSESLPLTLAGRVDAACDRFEADWKAGRRPRIEAYLAAAAESERPALLRELLMLELEFRARSGEHPTREGYRARFPEHEALIDATYTAARASDQATRPLVTGHTDSDRSLLFGILAVQSGLLLRDALGAGMRTWVLDKTQSLGRILAARGALSRDGRRLIEALVLEHLVLHGDDPARCLAELGMPGPMRADLEQITDPDLQAALARADPIRTAAEDADADGPRALRPLTAGGARFRILRPHAKGGLGEVYVARDAELRREVALKQIQDRHARDPGSRARFLAEAEITGKLEHPGVVPVYSLGQDPGGRPYYVMRLIRGDTLKEAVTRFHLADVPERDPGERALALHQLLRRFLDACNTVAFAHSRGILHRDLKPDNILLGPYGETLVVDWGLAKRAGRPGGSIHTEGEILGPELAHAGDATLPGSPIGTPSYMSPEQAAGRPDLLGPATDVYGLGATLYFLLTGLAPVEDRQLSRILERVQRGEFPAPRTVKWPVDPALEAICLKAMATDPAGRYDSPRPLADEIEHWLADEPVSAWREPWPARARRWLGRHQAAVTAAAAALIVAAAGLATVSAVQAGANRRLRVSRDQLAVAVGRETRANRELREANAREQVARAEAQHRFALARKAVEAYYTGASEDVLLKQPQLASLRNKLLNMSLAFYEELQGEIEREGRNDPATQAELAAAYARVGEITEQVGTRARALEALERARSIREALMTADPAAAAPVSDLAGVLETIGILQSRTTGREALALPTLERALALREAVAADRPDSPDDRAAVAASLRRMGNSLFPLGRPAEALRYLERAKTIMERLEAEYPDRESIRAESANVLKQVSYPERVSGRIDDSLRDLGRARQIFERLAVDHPGKTEYRARLAEVFSDLGSDLSTVGRLAEALEAEQQALTIHEKLAADSPANTDFQHMIASHRTAIGWILGDLGRREEALRSLVLAREAQERLVADHPDNVLFQRELAQSIGFIGNAEHDLGHPDKAFKTLELARALHERLPAEPIMLYNLACINSRLCVLAASELTGEAARARGDAYADKAIAALRRAVAAGYRQIKVIRKDPDLAPLRTRGDFQQILLDAVFPDDPFAR